MVLALLPGAALWVLARCGSFEGAASFWPKAAALATLVVVASLGARWWRDPLRLGTGTGWVGSARAAVAWLLVAVASVSMAMSPVARAGYVLVATLPFLLLVPAAVARLWVSRRARGVGLCGLAGALALVAGESLVRQVVEQHERAAMPLGHHNLLALWLLLLLPLPASLIALREQQTTGSRSTTRQGEGGVPSGAFTIAIAWLALLLGTAGLFATGSLAGAVGLVVEAAVAVVLLGARMPRRVRRILVAIVPALLLAIAVWQGPRLADVASGADPSLRARAAYWAAGLRGFSERPLLGWGPGASSWLLHEHLRPVPGAHPAYEVVTDVHSLPLEVLYEGGVALAIALGVVMLLYARARWRELAAIASRERALAGWLALVGLAGTATAATTSGAFDLPALAFAAAVVAGAAMTHATPPRETSPWSRRGWPLWAITAGALLLLVPDLRGHWHYQRAMALDSERVHGFHEMERASRADPGFPLYPMRRTLEPFSSQVPEQAFEASRLARGVAAFWLRAGAMHGGTPDEEPHPLQRSVLARACDLEPLGGLAPFLLARLATGDRAEQLLARALVAEPRLAASPWIERELLERALHAIEQVEEWPIGWRAAAVDRLRGLEVAAASAEEDPAAGSRDELADLVLAMDAEGSTALSLFVFRRTPRRAVLVSIPLRAETARSIDLPPLWSLLDVPGPRWARACGWLERPEP
ncbi:MAG TPA: O-antigen ligase family protein [Thermoanaerobaculia bacterium]|nr:O-antigen ligase family protein [Thermoanaerobaculia bacterium]